MRVGRRDYLVLKNLGNQGRRRLLAFDETAGPNGDLRVIQELPKNQATRQQLAVLSRLPQLHSSLPLLDNYHVERDRIIAVRQWVWGISLAEYLADCRAGKRAWPSTYIAVTKFRSFVHGLCQLHDRLRIVHGDIRPDNIVVGANPLNFVLMDFGNAWTEERGAHRAEGDGFHPGYAAPEMVDPTITPTDLSDQFSATVVLYELITHRLPFDELGGKAGWPAFRDKFRDYSPSVRRAIEGRGDLPRQQIVAVDSMIAKALHLDPAKRFSTGAAWRDSLDAIAHDMRQGSKIRGWGKFWIEMIGRIGSHWQRRNR